MKFGRFIFTASIFLIAVVQANHNLIAKGPFHIVAVNYCFEKSEPSNAVEFKK